MEHIAKIYNTIVLILNSGDMELIVLFFLICSIINNKLYLDIYNGK